MSTDMQLAGAVGSDADLISRTLAGDEAAFGALMERHQRKIFSVVLAILRDHSQADIVTHETFVQAYFHLGKFEKRSELETWLIRIAINKSRDILRSKKFVSLDILDEDGARAIDPADQTPDAERQVASSELRQAVNEAIESLSEQQKVIFRLRHLEEMSAEQIGSVLGLRSGTVRAHLFRAVQKVRSRLAALGWGVNVEASNETP